MRGRKVLFVFGVLAAGLVVGAVGARAATTSTIPRDHAQAFVTRDAYGRWVANRQLGFTNIENPYQGVWCFTLPASADPTRSVPVVTVDGRLPARPVGRTSENGLLANAVWDSTRTACPDANQISVVTGWDSGRGPFSGGIRNESFTIVVP